MRITSMKMSTWSTMGAARAGLTPVAWPLEHLDLHVLQLAAVRGLRDVAVLGVAEPDEHLVELLVLAGHAHEVDVRVLTVHEIQVHAVPAYGQAADEAHGDALQARRVDEVHGLGHEAVGAARRHGARRARRLQHGALGAARRAAQVLHGAQHRVQHGPRQIHARPALLADSSSRPLASSSRTARRAVGWSRPSTRWASGTVMQGVRKSSLARTKAWPLTWLWNQACWRVSART